jgi:hypothetical protein
MQRLVAIGLAVLCAIAVGWWLVGLSASAESRIRELLHSEAAAFNRAAALSVLSGFATDYRDETADVDRQTLKAVLLWAFRNRRDRTGRFRMRVELPDDPLTIAVRGDAAEAAFRLLLWDRAGAGESLVWELAVTAVLTDGEAGWRIASSRHQTLRGAGPR